VAGTLRQNERLQVTGYPISRSSAECALPQAPLGPEITEAVCELGARLSDIENRLVALLI
jgi:hypothetical protein